MSVCWCGATGGTSLLELTADGRCSNIGAPAASGFGGCPASAGAWRGKSVNRRIIRIAFGAAIASMAWAGTAPGENLPAGESVAKDRGPKTLLEGILGSSENDKVKERSAEEDHLDADRPFANNFVQDDLGISSHHELATGLTAVFQLTKKVEMFAEWDAFYPTGGLGSAAPRNYAVTGLVYFVTPDLQLDMRAGVGLNHAANDFLAGVGFAARY